MEIFLKNNMLLSIFAVGIAAVGTSLFIFAHHDSVPLAKITSVKPNMVKLVTAQQQCADEVYDVAVKNPKRNFINGIFDSKNNPKYIDQKRQKQRCKMVEVESEVQQGFAVAYQINNNPSTIILKSAPEVGAEISLVALDSMAESTSNYVSVGTAKQAPESDEQSIHN